MEDLSNGIFMYGSYAAWNHALIQENPVSKIRVQKADKLDYLFL